MNSLNGGMLGSLNDVDNWQQSQFEQMRMLQMQYVMGAQQGGRYIPDPAIGQSIEPPGDHVLLLLDA